MDWSLGYSDLWRFMRIIKVIGLISTILFAGQAWADITGMITPPAGSNGNVQFNKRGAFGADPTFTYSTTTANLTVSTITAGKLSITTMTVSTLNVTGLDPGVLMIVGTSSSVVTNFVSLSTQVTGTVSLSTQTSGQLPVNSLQSTGTFSLNGGTMAYTSAFTSGTITNTSTTTFQQGQFSGLRNDNSTTTWIGGGNTGTKNDSSTTTFLGGGFSGTRNDNSTTTSNGAVINGTVTNNSTATYTGQHNFYNGISVSTGLNLTSVFNVGQTSVSVKGITNGSNAQAGDWGEYISSASAASTSFPTSTNYADALAISLGAGDWDVGATCYDAGNGATWSNVEHALTTTAGNNTTGGVVGSNYIAQAWANSAVIITATYISLNYRFNSSSAFTVYLKAESTYTLGNPAYRCYLWGRRAR
jgi:hypothetical protein